MSLKDQTGGSVWLQREPWQGQPKPFLPTVYLKLEVKAFGHKLQRVLRQQHQDLLKSTHTCLIPRATALQQPQTWSLSSASSSWEPVSWDIAFESFADWPVSSEGTSGFFMSQFKKKKIFVEFTQEHILNMCSPVLFFLKLLIFLLSKNNFPIHLTVRQNQDHSWRREYCNKDWYDW